MKSVAYTEALLAWILVFGNECFIFHQRLVYGQGYPQYRINEYPYKDSVVNPYYRNESSYYPVESMQNSLTCNCSWGTVPSNQLKAKIVGGKVVSIRENYPMMAGIMNDVKECIFCGGSILTEYHVLTAAHCVYDENLSEMILAVGVRDRCKKKNSPGQFIRLLKTGYVHEYYDAEENHNDIAIVLGERKIIFSNNVGPTCIHTQPFTSRDTPILILGWGKIGEHYGPSSVLLKVFVKRVDTKYCRTKVPEGYINDNLNLQMCTYGGTKDACGGDSGGPLMVLDSSMNRLTQVALVSMGQGCARIDVPAVNTALHPYIGWMQWIIEQSMRKHYPKDYEKCGNSFCHITSPKIR